MRVIRTIAVWLGVTLIEAGVFYYLWWKFIEPVFIPAPELTYQEGVGLLIAARIFLSDPLLRPMERKSGNGDPLIDMAYFRIKVAILTLIVGFIVHQFTPDRRKLKETVVDKPQETSVPSL